MNAMLEFPPIEEPGPVEIAAEVVDRADIKDGKPLVKYSRTELALSDLRQKYAGKTFDLTTTKGDKEARAARLELVTLRTGLERKRKELKAPALEIGKTIDAEAARITKEIEALEQPIDAQIKADEKRRAEEAARKAAGEAFRVALHKAMIDRINGYARDAVGLAAERIAKGVAFVEGLTFGDETQDHRAQYEAAKNDTLASLRKLLADAKAAEATEAQRLENERVARELEEQREALEKQAAELLAQRVAATHAIVFAFPEPDPVVEVVSATAPDASVPAARESVSINLPSVDASSHEFGCAVGALPSRPFLRAEIAEPVATAAQPAQEEATVRLGEICTRVGQGFTMTAAFVETVLGIKPAAVDKAAKLYTPTDERRIYAALIKHLQARKALATKQIEAVAA